MRVRWSARAMDQLRAIFAHIVRDRPETAEKVFEALIERVRLLAEFPQQGSVLGADDAQT